VELTTPFSGTPFALPGARPWNPASSPIPAPPSSGCVGCPDWTGPTAPWQTTVLAAAPNPGVSALPRLDLRT
jgi:hypothetical protein